MLNGNCNEKFRINTMSLEIDFSMLLLTYEKKIFILAHFFESQNNAMNKFDMKDANFCLLLLYNLLFYVIILASKSIAIKFV